MNAGELELMSISTWEVSLLTSFAIFRHHPGPRLGLCLATPTLSDGDAKWERIAIRARSGPRMVLIGARWNCGSSR